jgi:hypothetical protein
MFDFKMPDLFKKELTNDEIEAQPDGDKIFNDRISKIDKKHKDDCEKSYDLNQNKIAGAATFNDLTSRKKYEYLVDCLEDKKSGPEFIGHHGGKRQSRKRNQKKSKKNHKKSNARKSRRHRRQ